MSEDDDYEVGYGRPPRRTQFKRGRSGNPRGRPRGSKNLSTIVKRELNSPIQIKEDGRPRTIRRNEAIVKGMVADALQGKDRPRERLLDYAERFEQAEGQASEATDVTQKDRGILRRYVERQLRPRRGPSDHQGD
jgi:Family of unknown function (DUF5681)